MFLHCRVLRYMYHRYTLYGRYRIVGLVVRARRRARSRGVAPAVADHAACKQAMAPLPMVVALAAVAGLAPAPTNYTVHHDFAAGTRNVAGAKVVQTIEECGALCVSVAKCGAASWNGPLSHYKDKNCNLHCDVTLTPSKGEVAIVVRPKSVCAAPPSPPPSPSPPSPPPPPPARIFPNAYNQLPLGSSTPDGWMRSQLLAQYHGLSGRGWLDRKTRATDSVWVGGAVGANGPLQEAFPYWLNGALPLAVLLNDTQMLRDVDRMFTDILEAAHNVSAPPEWQGWFGPRNDPWPTFRFLTCLTQYIDYTGDLRAVDAMIAFGNTLKSKMNLRVWAFARAEEAAKAYEWLLSSRFAPTEGSNASKTALEIIDLALQHGANWTQWYDSTAANPLAPTPPYPPAGELTPGATLNGKVWKWRQINDTAEECEAWCAQEFADTLTCMAYNWIPRGCSASNNKPAVNNSCQLLHAGTSLSSPTDANKTCASYHVMHSANGTLNPWFPESTIEALKMVDPNVPGVTDGLFQGVNNGQGLSSWEIDYRRTGNVKLLARGRPGWERMLKAHGMAHGVPSGDQFIAGALPNRGSETCFVVEVRELTLPSTLPVPLVCLRR
jgi:hypothetical protein